MNLLPRYKINNVEEKIYHQKSFVYITFECSFYEDYRSVAL